MWDRLWSWFQLLRARRRVEVPEAHFKLWRHELLRGRREEFEAEMQGRMSSRAAQENLALIHARILQDKRERAHARLRKLSPDSSDARRTEDQK